ncbi:MAG TPA: iron-sulfur cluster repair di-iron protein [Hanamia sp.]
METLLEQENILNVTLIEPKLKHPTIFVRFDELVSGESLVLHNDHDPKPLYYELAAERGEIFTWEYLEQGPELWKVKITKDNLEAGDKENILDATLLDPRVKHATIFARFDELNPGEFLILHNDHDPMPLRFQLENTRGNIFTWEYLEQGPELFRIKISKNKVAIADEKIVKTSEKENILNVTLIEPKLKHPTIFVKFDELNPGESLIIHNDHDPKPLYYQLLGERGNIFVWEYLEQGPQLWRVKISKKVAGEKDETLGEIAAKDLRKAEVFKKYGLDFCCGGKKTVKEACAEKGLDVTKVEQELQTADKNITGSRPLPYNDWSLDFLADYIVNTHHSYVKKTIPDLRSYASKVASVHGSRHPELLAISQLTDEVCEELSLHMVKEETVLFPYIKQLAASKNNGNPLQKGTFNTVQAPINMMEHEHDVVGKKLEQIRTLSNNYALPEDACASYSYLFKTLDEFENDLHIHVHLENNILFPKSLDLEKE